MGNQALSSVSCTSHSYHEKLHDQRQRLSLQSIGDDNMIPRRAAVLQKPVHSDAITALCLVRPGLVISGSADKTLVLSNYETNEKMKLWQGHEREITKVAYDSTIQRQCVLSGSRDATIRLWTFHSSECCRVFVGHEMVVSGLALIDGTANHLCSGSRDNSLKLWDIETGGCLATKKIAQNLVTHISWSKIERYLAQTSEDKELKLWDPRNFDLIYAFPKTQYIQSYCDVSHDGLYCLTCTNGFNSSGCELLLWDVRQRKLLQRMTGHEQSVNCAIFVPNTFNSGGAESLHRSMDGFSDGRNLLLSASTDHTLKLWNANGGCLWTENVPSGGSLLSIACCKDGSVLVGGQNACLCYMKIAAEHSRTYLAPQTMQIHYAGTSYDD